MWARAILPKIIADATPAMPKKGANLGVKSPPTVSAIFSVVERATQGPVMEGFVGVVSGVVSVEEVVNR